MAGPLQLPKYSEELEPEDIERAQRSGFSEETLRQLQAERRARAEAERWTFCEWLCCFKECLCCITTSMLCGHRTYVRSTYAQRDQG